MKSQPLSSVYTSNANQCVDENRKRFQLNTSLDYYWIIETLHIHTHEALYRICIISLNLNILPWRHFRSAIYPYNRNIEQTLPKQYTRWQCSKSERARAAHLDAFVDWLGFIRDKKKKSVELARARLYTDKTNRVALLCHSSYTQSYWQPWRQYTPIRLYRRALQ